ncbi:MAG TPA: AtpZ/AtpI family protein [Terriglobales bacterium]|jgi:F0F1-type ATP synthase assembly protein I
MAESLSPDPQDTVGTKKKDDAMVSIAKYSHLGLVLPAAAFVGWIIGYGLDHLLHTTWITWAGLGLGVFAGFYDLIRAAVQMGRE